MNVCHETDSTVSTGLNGIASLIEQTFKVSLIRMKSDQRNKETSEARRTFAKMAHDLGYNYCEIARFLNKDHSSVIYMVKK